MEVQISVLVQDQAIVKSWKEWREEGKKIRKDRREEGRQEGEEGGRDEEGGRVGALVKSYHF